MKYTRKVVTFFVALCIGFSCMTCTVSASKADGILADSSSDTSLNITPRNWEYLASNEKIPIEVRIRISELLENASEKTCITLITPSSNPELRTSTSLGWSYPRQYNGYTLKDYIIKVQNAFDMENIKTSTASNPQLAAQFGEYIAISCGSSLLEKVKPYGGLANTIIDFIIFTLGLDSDVITPASGDKVNAAPKYTTHEYYTYVETLNGDVHGATTYASNLESVMWYFYSEKNHQQYSNSYSYNKMKYSTNWNDRDRIAFQSHTNIPSVDDRISVKIGTKTFVLS